jgi:6-pyruvoyltetrahydropterin/6-carboxytetrahydropterin synthase
MYEVGVVAQFRARHHLVGDFGPASVTHEHGYRVEVAVYGATPRPDGTLLDITILDRAVGELTGQLEGRDLNEFPQLARPNSTAESVARFFFNRIAVALEGQGLSQLEVKVWESPQAYGAYSADLA